MIKFKLTILLVIGMFAALHGYSQTENNYWLFLIHNQKLSKHWSLTGEVQLRSSDNLERLQSLLLRPSVGYSFKEGHRVSLGYAYLENYTVVGDMEQTNPEHRIWEQYNIKTNIKRTEFTNRFRYEQRFVKRDETRFSQRFRYFFRFIFPLQSGQFNSGLYAALQNEVFLNVHNKENVNNSFFDQNRTYGSLGYRFSKKVDLEAGYIFRYQKMTNSRLRNHIIQLALYTNF